MRITYLTALLHVGLLNVAVKTTATFHYKHPTLAVARGKSVYIQPSDLNLTSTGGVPCKVKVLTDDLNALRVGAVEPTVSAGAVFIVVCVCV